MNYRHLTDIEIQTLQAQSCGAEDWSRIQVCEGFSPQYICNVIFSGDIYLGVFEAKYTLPCGITKQSGIRNATLHNVKIGDNCLIENIRNYIANYDIASNSLIENVDIMQVVGCSSFGNGVAVSVLNETGGREVYINDKLSAHLAYIAALYRHRPILVAKIKEITDYYAAKHSYQWVKLVAMSRYQIQER